MLSVKSRMDYRSHLFCGFLVMGKIVFSFRIIVKRNKIPRPFLSTHFFSTKGHLLPLKGTLIILQNCMFIETFTEFSSSLYVEGHDLYFTWYLLYDAFAGQTTVSKHTGWKTQVQRIQRRNNRCWDVAVPKL